MLRGGTPVSAWWSGSAVLWDLETDSKEPTDARIITSCIAYVHAGHETEIDTWLVKPERDIPEEAAAIHGVSTARATEHGVDRGEAIAEIAQGLHLIHRDA